MARPATLALALGALAAAGCDRFGPSEAEALVRRYNERNIQAFRTGDARLTEETSGEAEGRKLVGLIGVRADLGAYHEDRTDIVHQQRHRCFRPYPDGAWAGNLHRFHADQPGGHGRR